MSYARVKRTVFSLDLNIVRVDACLTSSWRMFQILALASACLLLILGTTRKPLPEVLGACNVSNGSNISEMYCGAKPWKVLYTSYTQVLNVILWATGSRRRDWSTWLIELYFLCLCWCSCAYYLSELSQCCGRACFIHRLLKKRGTLDALCDFF